MQQFFLKQYAKNICYHFPLLYFIFIVYIPNEITSDKFRNLIHGLII